MTATGVWCRSPVSPSSRICCRSGTAPVFHGLILGKLPNSSAARQGGLQAQILLFIKRRILRTSNHGFPNRKRGTPVSCLSCFRAPLRSVEITAHPLAITFARNSTDSMIIVIFRKLVHRFIDRTESSPEGVRPAHPKPRYCASAVLSSSAGC